MPVSSERPPRNGFVARARKVYNLIGFTKGYNFCLFVIFGGALLGFSLARLQYLDFYGTYCNPDRSKTSSSLPGECFYFLQPFYATGMILHLACILPAAILALIQFVPAVRHKVILFHRINGYFILLLSVGGTVGGLMIARRAAGGDISTQTSVGFVGLAFVTALVVAWASIKKLRIDLHRAWMLRAWVWAGSIITMRLLFILIAIILSKTGTYYYSQPCAKVAWALNDDTQMRSTYPQCAGFLDGSDPDQQVSVRATFVAPQNVAEVMSVLNMTFGTAMILGFLLHALGVELYLAFTRDEAARLRKISLERWDKVVNNTVSVDA
ncbi:hypothetical protein Micbo1qcDRAFT_218379 [Microdochium bolleyi]|uniref:Microtubule associated protein n=1 Tax=Microdochium bolleyi TaxID=196109 RepID=A0A136IQB9_9PEZI|nr:hypothetical protein Micbo1qcDRAFT_218379 [Microdochium bolleyi]